jgi:hypothetical protein
MGKKSDTARESPQQRALAEMAQKQMADYQSRWLPVQRKLAEGIQRDGAVGSSARKQAAASSATESAVRFGQARGGLEAALSDSGAGPNSSKFKLGMAGLGNDEATSRGLGFVAADQAIDDAYMQGLGMLTALGRGERSGAMTGMSQVAAMSGQQAAADAAMSAQRRAGNAQALGQVAGYGLSQFMKPADAPAVQPDYSVVRPAGPGGGSGQGLKMPASW